MAISRCDSCNGQRQIRGLGMIVKDCSECKGVGYKKITEPMKMKEEDETDKFLNKSGDEIKVVRRGRPKRDK